MVVKVLPTPVAMAKYEVAAMAVMKNVVVCIRRYRYEARWDEIKKRTEKPAMMKKTTQRYV